VERPVKKTLTIEFKSDRKCYAMEKLYEDLVGMANTDGGWLFLGVEDDGTLLALTINIKIASIWSPAYKTTQCHPCLYTSTWKNGADAWFWLSKCPFPDSL
jgi:predicted HTH transcriptional regulator